MKDEPKQGASQSQGGTAPRGSGGQRRESSDKGGVRRNEEEHQGREDSTPFTPGTHRGTLYNDATESLGRTLLAAQEFSFLELIIVPAVVQVIAEGGICVT